MKRRGDRHSHLWPAALSAAPPAGRAAQVSTAFSLVSEQIQEILAARLLFLDVC